MEYNTTPHYCVNQRLVEIFYSQNFTRGLSTCVQWWTQETCKLADTVCDSCLWVCDWNPDSIQS